MRYFQTKTALDIDAMESIVEEAAQEETEAEQIQSVLEGVAGYMISDDSLTRWLGCWWRWRRNRRLITYRGEAKL